MERTVKDSMKVTEVHRRVQEILESATKNEFWVTGEVQSYKPKDRSGPTNIFFELVERRSPQTVPSATLKSVISPQNGMRILNALQKEQNLSLTNGLEIKVRGSLTTYAPRGDLQFKITDIDASYTLGKIAASKEELIKKLASENLVTKNSQLPLRKLPLRVGLIASKNSDGYQDFLKALSESKYSWQVLHCDAIVQGESAARSVVDALENLSRSRGDWLPDVICIVRGGGSKTDLMAFDYENIARKITSMQIPVLTGIGHDNDRSVADEVAYKAYKTPTAVAMGLIERVRETHDRYENIYQSISKIVLRDINKKEEQLLRVEKSINVLSLSLLKRSEEKLDLKEERLKRSVKRNFQNATRESEQAARRLKTIAFKKVEKETESLLIKEQLVLLLDPKRLLQKGYSITRTKEGVLVKEETQLEKGTELITEIFNKKINSTVI